MTIGDVGRRGLAGVTILMTICLAMTVSPAMAQGGAVPPEVAQALDRAIAAANTAANNAAISATIARAPSYDDVAARTRQRISESAIAEAVIDGIARHPGSASAIVGAAVKRAPTHRDAIVHRASLAFPAFTAQIAAGAGMAAPPAAPAYAPQPSYAALVTHAPGSGYSTPPAYAPGPVYAPQPAYTQPQGGVPNDQRIVVARSGQTGAAPSETVMRSEATAPGRAGPLLGISELRLGIHKHDAGVFGRNEEDGIDVSIEARFPRFTGGLWDIIWQPRAHLGANVNSGGDTNSIYAGLTWDWQIWRPFFFSFDLGGAAHDGELSTSRLDKKELGSRFLFREAVEIGYRMDGHHAVSLRFDHMSNASLADENEGLDTVGVVYGYSF